LFLIVLALAQQACQPLSEPFHFLLKLRHYGPMVLSVHPMVSISFLFFHGFDH
jgi:hypothetical protein